MRRGLGYLSLVLLLWGFITVVCAQEKKDEKKDDKKADTQNKQAVNKALEKARKPGKPLIGRIVRIDEAEETISIELPLIVPQINQGAIQRASQIQGEMAQARARNDINQVRNLASELARQQPVTYREEKKVVEFEIGDEMKVRTMVLAPEFTEKGKLRKMTEKEKRDLKGPDPKLKGWNADSSNLQTDQVVEVYFVPVKQTPMSKTKTEKTTPKTKTKAEKTEKAKPEKGEKTKADSKGEAGDDEDPPKPKLTMIVILSEPAK